MANKSLGTLYVDIIARTEKLEQDMARAKNQIADLASETKKAGSEAKAAFESFKLFNLFQGRGMTGITLDMMAFMLAVQAVKKEILYVIENIERIPGISPEAVANVKEFKSNLADARNTIDGWIASGLSGFLQFGKMVGVGAAMLAGNDGDLPLEVESVDKLRAASDPAFWEKVRAAQLGLSEARKADARASMELAERIVALRKDSEAYEKFSKSASLDSLQRIDAQKKAYQLEKEANQLRTEALKQYEGFRRREQTEEFRDGLQELSQRDRILQIEQKIGELRVKAFPMRAESGIDGITRMHEATKGELTDKELQTALEKFPQLLQYMAMLRQEMKSIRTPAQEMRDAFTSGFKDMAVAGRQFLTGMDTDFNKLLKVITDRIIETFLTLAIINPILNAMFGGTKGWSILPSLFGGVGKKAAGGPGSGWTLVGEEGPELVPLGGGSTVIPAWKTRQMLGQGGGGNVYQIDARGADIGAVVRIEQALMALAGPGVVEQRSLAAQQDYAWRHHRS